MEILSTLFATLLVLGLAEARPYAELASASTTSCTSKKTTSTTCTTLSTSQTGASTIKVYPSPDLITSQSTTTTSTSSDAIITTSTTEPSNTSSPPSRTSTTVSSTTSSSIDTTSTSSTSSSITSTSSSASSTTTSSGTSSSTTSSSTTSSSTTSSSTTSSSTTSRSTTTSNGCTPSPTASSGKRGLAYNFEDATRLFSTTTCPATSGDSKVTWAYNWYSAPQDPWLGGAPATFHPNLQFVPMLWSAAPDLTSVWLNNVAIAKSRGWTELLAFNEPDLCHPGAGASCIPIDDAVAAYQQWYSPLKDEGFRLGAPAVTNAVGEELGNDWLIKFMQRCNGCNIDFIPIHWYGTHTDFDSFFSHLHYTYNDVGGGQYPIWITEFAVTTGTDEQIQNFMEVVMAALDSGERPWVEKYSWFMAGRPGVMPGNLVEADHRNLTVFGELYDKF